MRRSTLSSVLRSNQVYCELLCDKQTLQWGIAYHSRRWAALPEANQFREVLIPDAQEIPDAFAQAEKFFADQGLTCRRWAPAADQSAEALGEFLVALGYARRETAIMVLRSWPDLVARSDYRILPARPMRAAFRGTFGSQTVRAAAAAEAAIERLDEPRLDMFVALEGDRPVGRAGLLEVGDIGRLTDFHVAPDQRRRGVATALMEHVLALARRAAVRLVCLQADLDAVAFFESCGFVRDGSICEFDAASP